MTVQRGVVWEKMRHLCDLTHGLNVRGSWAPWGYEKSSVHLRASLEMCRRRTGARKSDATCLCDCRPPWFRALDCADRRARARGGHAKGRLMLHASRLRSTKTAADFFCHANPQTTRTIGVFDLTMPQGRALGRTRCSMLNAQFPMTCTGRIGRQSVIP